MCQIVPAKNAMLILGFTKVARDNLPQTKLTSIAMIAA